MAIQLRKTEPTDLPYLYKWENDASAWAYGINHNPMSQQDLRHYIENTTGDIYIDGQLRLIIENTNNNEDKETNKSNKYIVGCIDLFDFDTRNRRIAIGIYIAPEFRNNGYGTKAIQILEKYTFEFLDMRLIYAIVSVANTISNRMFAKLDYISTSHLSNWTLEGDAIVWQKIKK